MGRHMDGLAAARHPRSCLARLVTSMASQSQAASRLAQRQRYFPCCRHGCGSLPANPLRLGAAASRRDKIAKLALLGHDHAFAELAGGVDDIADHPSRQYPLGVIGQQHDIRARHSAGWRSNQFLFRCLPGRRGQFPVRTSMCVEKCSGTQAHLRVVGRSGIANQPRFRSALLRPALPSICCPASSSPISPTKMQRCAQCGDVRADVAGAADMVSLRWTAITGAGAPAKIRTLSP